MSQEHDWKRHGADFYICRICGGMISILADYAATKYGCKGNASAPENIGHTTIDIATADADGYRNGRASILDGLRDRILIALRDEDSIDNPSQMTDLVMRAIEVKNGN